MPDIDDVLAYTTVKLVKIRDFRLGVFHYALQLAILLYVIISSIIIEKGYQTTEVVSMGSVNLNARQPSVYPAMAYCCTFGDPGCDGSTSSPDKGEPPNSVLPCVYLDAGEAVFPVVSDISLALTTRLSLETDVRSGNGDPACATVPSSDNCTYSRTGKQGFYVAHPEGYTLRIRHGVVGKQLDVSYSTEQMSGQFVNANQDVLREWPSSTPFAGQPQDETRAGDILSVQELLAGAEFALDQLSPFTKDVTRYDGINILVFITYEVDSAGAFGGTPTLKYTYLARTISFSEYSSKPSSAGLDITQKTRTSFNAHSVRFIFVQDGLLGQFDFRSLLISLATGLALLAAASAIVDLVMTKIMSLKKEYSDAKYQMTVDFSEHRDKSSDDEKEKDKKEGETELTPAADGAV